MSSPRAPSSGEGRKPALDAALVVIRKAGFRRAALHVDRLIDRLCRDYPGCRVPTHELVADVVRLAAREGVTVVLAPEESDMVAAD